jgi:hypothetical protein
MLAVKVVGVTYSTNTVNPLRYDCGPGKPSKRKPSLTVGSAPVYVKVAVPYLRMYPVIARVVA